MPFLQTKRMTKQKKQKLMKTTNGTVEFGAPLVFPPKEMPCEAAVIWLHGFGDGPEGWAHALEPLRRTNPRWKWVHPRAPLLPQTCYGGVHEHAWGDFLDPGCVHVGSEDHENQDGAEWYAATKSMVQELLQKFEKEDGLPSSRTVVAGFSQGAASAAQVAFQYSDQLAGCVMLSGWLLPATRAALASSPSRTSPCLVCHGTQDDQVGFDCGKLAAQSLKDIGAAVQFEVFDGMGHTDCPREHDLLRKFLKRILPNLTEDENLLGTDNSDT